MSEIVIRVENLGKKYRIQRQNGRHRYVALRDVLADKFSAPWRWLGAQSSNGHGKGALLRPSPALSKAEDFWALMDVTFEVRRGEVVGIIGRNGAGKSTLLKLLSRITEPTAGRARIRGRVASLLEVGTGFHPELTGRENIFLNGAILGMTNAEIRKKFDEIAAFAEIEKFLDTPVKRYSSGMYVRLAFAVAAHLEPEILVVDEVLAVGDAAFQKKCIARMSEVTGSAGSTVLLVSHNHGMIRSLCHNAILLEGGRLTLSGSAKSVCDQYQAVLSESQGWSDAKVKLSSTGFREIQVCDGAGQMTSVLEYGAPFRVRCRVQLPPTRSFITFTIKSAGSGPVAELYDVNFNPSLSEPEERVVESVVENPNLLPGDYTIDAWLGEGLHETVERLIDCCSFTVVEGGGIEIGKQLALGPSGLVFLKSSWRTARLQSI